MAAYAPHRSFSPITVVLGLLLLAVVGYLVYTFWLQPEPPKTHRPAFGRPGGPAVRPGMGQGPTSPPMVTPYIPGQGPRPTGFGDARPPGGAYSWTPSAPMSAPPMSQPPSNSQIVDTLQPAAVMSQESFRNLIQMIPVEDESNCGKMSQKEIESRIAERDRIIAQQDAWKLGAQSSSAAAAA